MQKWINITRQIAKTSSHAHYKMAAILIKGGNIVSIGTNNSNPAWKFIRDRSNRSNLGRHAEISCLWGLNERQTKNGTIVVAGTTAAGNQIKSKPCKDCYRFLSKMKIKKVIYQDKDKIIMEKIK